MLSRCRISSTCADFRAHLPRVRPGSKITCVIKVDGEILKLPWNLSAGQYPTWFLHSEPVLLKLYALLALFEQSSQLTLVCRPRYYDTSILLVEFYIATASTSASKFGNTLSILLWDLLSESGT
jgi:hypothetical protein